MSNNGTHLIVYAVTKFEDRDGKAKSRWTRIGVMFPHSKAGYQIKLELAPLDPKADIVAMPPREKEDE